MINVYAKSEEIETVKKQITSLEQRISSLEAKSGMPEEVSQRLGIAIKNLPMPVMTGQSELENVRQTFQEINITLDK